MNLSIEQINLIKQAYDCLDKVTEDIPIDTEDKIEMRLWRAFAELTAIDSDLDL